ncbi:MAG: hypothetical protein IIB46_02480 [Nitrospinae bacterium]|nr:hypothetical protein [Nitrospinota bacterium]
MEPDVALPFGLAQVTGQWNTDFTRRTIDDLSEPSTGLGVDLYISDGAGGSFLAIEGGADAIVTISGVEKGGKDLGTATFAFTTDAGVIATVDDSGTTMDDFLDCEGIFFG